MAEHGLVKVSYATRKAYQFRLLLTRNQVEEATKAVAKVFRMGNGATNATLDNRGGIAQYVSIKIYGAVKHFSSKWSISINKSTARKPNV